MANTAKPAPADLAGMQAVINAHVPSRAQENETRRGLCNTFPDTVVADNEGKWLQMQEKIGI